MKIALIIAALTLGALAADPRITVAVAAIVAKVLLISSWTRSQS